MLTCLDGMKLNCLAKRYLETSTTARGFWSHFQDNCSFSGCHLKTACNPFWIFLSHLLCPPLQTSTLCVWQLCRLCSLNLVRQNIFVLFLLVLFFPIENCIRVFHRDKCSTSQNKKSLLYSDEACPFFFKEQNMCSYENRRVWLDAGSRPKKQPRIASICQHKMWKWTTKKMNSKNRLSRPIPLIYHP